MNANDYLSDVLGLNGCPECDYSADHTDWTYVPYSNKEAVKCPRCGTIVNENDMAAVDAKIKEVQNG